MFSLKVFSTPSRRAFSITTLCLLALTMVSVTACFKKTVTKEGAAALKADIEHVIDLHMANTGPDDEGVRFQRDGELTVTPVEDHYDVVFPHFSIKTLDNGTLDFGVIKATAIPAGQDKYRVSMELPATMTGTDPDGAPFVTLDIGSQKHSGIWHSKYDLFYELDADYGDIRLSLPDTGENGDNVQLTIGSFTGKVKYQDLGDGKITGPASFTLNDIALSSAAPDAPDTADNREKHLTIAQVQATGNSVNFDAKRMAEMQEALIRMSQEIDGKPEAGDEFAVAAVTTLQDFLKNCVDSGDSFINFRGIDISFDAPSTPEKTLHFGIDNIGMGLTLDGVKSDAATMGISFDIEGVNITPTPEEATNYLPFSTNFNLTLEKLPYQTLIGNLGDALVAMINQGDDDDAGEFDFDCNCADVISQAGTLLRLDGTHASAGPISADLTGSINANNEAAMGAAGDLSLVIKGVSKAIAALSQPGTPPEAVQQGMQVLGMMQAMGKPQVAEDGSTELVYDLHLGEDGTATLNGNPVPMPGLPAAPAMPDDEPPISLP